MQLPLVRKSCSDNEEFIFIWRFFQLRCIPSIVLAKYAWYDSLKIIKANKKFYKHEVKKTINEVGKTLESKITQLTSVDSIYKNYIGEYCDTMEELLEKELRIFHSSIESKLKGAFIEDIEFYSAIHYVRELLSLAFLEYHSCFKDVISEYNVDVSKHFNDYDVSPILAKWDMLCAKADSLLSEKDSKGHTIGKVNFNKGRTIEAFKLIREKLADVSYVYKALEAAYPYSNYYDASIPFKNTPLAEGLLQSMKN